MKTLILVSSLLLLSTAVGAAQPEAPADRETTRAAVRRSLTFLAEDMDAWRAKRKCAACHHGPMFVWAGAVAQRQGYAVDLAKVRETTTWMIEDQRARVFGNAPGAAVDRVSLASLYLAHALNSLPHEDPQRAAGWRRVSEHWQATQQSSGEWIGAEGRPPIFNTPDILTRLANLALAEAAPLETQPASGATAVFPAEATERATTWLRNAPANDTHQGLALRLWAAALEKPTEATDADSPSRQWLQQLRVLQQVDGGWQQAEGMPSDAFATGQTLVAMHRNRVPCEDPAVARAIEFLVRTQSADGSWPMRSRPNPATGLPATFLNPITYAATAWATLGLTLYVPEAKRSSPPIH